ncbi:MAG: hypothetical protein ACJAUS_002410 [Qipengyuania sp.]|jgi:hypothetical protein
MEDRIIQYLDAADNALAQYGPQAVELAMWMGRIGAIQAIVTPLLFTTACIIILAWPLRTLWRGASNINDSADAAIARFVILIAAAVVIGFAIVGIVSFINIYAWIGIFHPEIWIAHTALNAIA